MGESENEKSSKIGLGILGIIVLVFLVALVINMNSPHISSFDRALITGVNEGVPTTTLMADIEKTKATEIEIAQTGYNATLQTDMPDLIAKAKIRYDKKVVLSQQRETIRLQFVKGEISEDKFVTEMDNIENEASKI